MPHYKTANGFTLVEMVVAIVLLGIAAVLLTSVLSSSLRVGAEPQQQVRAAEFAQSLLHEIMAKAYDENTGPGGVPMCDGGTVNCTVAAALGAEAGETHESFDDVDDYDAWCAVPVAASNLTGDIGGLAAFTMQVCVDYDGDYDGVVDANTAAKLITVTVIYGTGASNRIVLQAYRGNY